MSPGMKRHILNILILLLASTAVLSCSAGILNETDAPQSQTGSFKLVISGSVSDMESAAPLEDIRIVMRSVEKIGGINLEEQTHTAYSDSKGTFTINMGGFHNPVSVELETNDPKGIYKHAKHEIPLITWDSSYNMSGNTFFINDCNFYLEKQ